MRNTGASDAFYGYAIGAESPDCPQAIDAIRFFQFVAFPASTACNSTAWPYDDAMIYDTLKMAQRLEGPFTRDQALALTEALANEASETIATKADLADLRGEMIEGFAALDSKITALESKIVAVDSRIVTVESKIVTVESKIVTVESNLIKWIAGALVLNLFGTAGLIITLTKALAR